MLDSAISSDENRSGDAAFEQCNATQDQRAHDALAQFGLTHHEIANPRCWYQQRFHVGACHAIDERGIAGKHRDFGQKRTCGVDHDRRFLPEGIMLDHGDFAGKNDEHAGADGAGFYDMFARGKGSRAAEATQPLDLGKIQRGKNLRPACFNGGSFSHIPEYAHQCCAIQIVELLSRKPRRRLSGTYQEICSDAVKNPLCRRAEFVGPDRQNTRTDSRRSLPRSAVPQPWTMTPR